MALRLMPRSPRRRIRLVTVIGGLKVLSRPVGLAKTSADLTPATGARTTRFCRTQPPVFAKRLNRALAPSSCRSDIAHGINPPCAIGLTPTLPRPPHPVPTFVTMANAPLLGDETARLIVLICPTGEAEYFFGDVWTGQITLKEFGKSPFWRNGVWCEFDGRLGAEGKRCGSPKRTAS
jgi:hypothetical protein